MEQNIKELFIVSTKQNTVATKNQYYYPEDECQTIFFNSHL